MKHHATIIATIGTSLGSSVQTDVERLYRIASARLLGKVDPLDQPDPKVKLTDGTHPVPWASACNTDTGLVVQLAACDGGSRLTISRLLVHEGFHNATSGCRMWL